MPLRRFTRFFATCLCTASLAAACEGGRALELRLPPSVTAPASAAAVAADGSWAVVAGGDFVGLLQHPRPGFAYIVNLRHHSIERRLPRQGDGDSGAVILGGGKSRTIVTSSYDGTVVLSKFGAVPKSVRVPLNAGAITALATTADGKDFVAAGYKGNLAANAATIVVCDAHARILRRYQAGQELIRSISCSPDGRMIATCDLNHGDVALVNVKSGRRRVLRSHRPRIWKQGIFFEDYANGVAFTRAGLLLVGGQTGDIRHHPAGWVEAWNLEKGRVAWKIRCEHAVAFVTAEGGTIATIEGNQLTGRRASLGLWSLRTLKAIPFGHKPLGRLSIIAFFAHGHAMLYATDGGVIGTLRIGRKR